MASTKMTYHIPNEIIIPNWRSCVGKEISDPTISKYLKSNYKNGKGGLIYGKKYVYAMCMSITATSCAKVVIQVLLRTTLRLCNPALERHHTEADDEERHDEHVHTARCEGEHELSLARRLDVWLVLWLCARSLRLPQVRVAAKAHNLCLVESSSSSATHVPASSTASQRASVPGLAAATCSTSSGAYSSWHALLTCKARTSLEP